MSQPIIFTITQNGRNAALDTTSPGLRLKLDALAVFDREGNQWGRYDIAGGGVEANSSTLRFSSIIKSPVRKEGWKIQLLSDTGIVFAESSSNTQPLVVAEGDISFAVWMGLYLGDIPASNLTVAINRDEAVSLAIMGDHLAAGNPHPQYPLRSPLMEALFSIMGGTYITNDPRAPDEIFNQLFGYQTFWRELPADTMPGKRVWERYDPNSDNSWQITANRESVNEGDVVVFTIKAGMSLTDGSRVRAILTEGGNVIDTRDVTITNGTGQTQRLVPADMTTNPGRSVRLHLESIPYVYCEVPINDTSTWDVNAGNGDYAPGSYSIMIGPGLAKKVTLVAGGGGGGGSTGDSSSMPMAGDGGDAFIYQGNSSIMRASGGKRGTNGSWGNGSDYEIGSGGAGGYGFESRHGTGLEVTVNQMIGGTSGAGSADSQAGAPSTFPPHGAGGNGSKSGGGNWTSWGGGGGAGGTIIATLRNTSESPIAIRIDVPRGGNDTYHDSNVNNRTQRGGDGFARVETA